MADVSRIRQTTLHLSERTGILAAFATLAANAELFQFRNNVNTIALLVHKVQFSADVTTTYFAAGVPAEIKLFKATAWTAQGTGGTALVVAALAKRATAAKNSVVASGDIRISTTAGLGAGTKTLEAFPLKTILSRGPAADTGGKMFPEVDLFNSYESGEPLVIAFQEGLVIMEVAMPATGTWAAAVTIDWSEVPA